MLQKNYQIAGQISVDYYESNDQDPNEDNDVDFVAENELEQAASIAPFKWGSRHTAARTEGVKLGPAASLNPKDVILLCTLYFLYLP
jgi:hypothetical protein